MAHSTHLVYKVLSKSDFQAQLKEAGTKLVIIDFFATWCGPCKTISPIMEKMAESMTDVVFLKVDVDEVDELATDYNIKCMPTFVAVREGKQIGEMSGASPEKLKNFIEEKNKN